MLDPYAKPEHETATPIPQGSTWADPVSGAELPARKYRNALQVDTEGLPALGVVSPPRFDTVRLVGPAVPQEAWPEPIRELVTGDLGEGPIDLPGRNEDTPAGPTLRATQSTVTLAWDGWAWARVYLDPARGKPRVELQVHPAALWAHACPLEAYRRAVSPLVEWLSWAFGGRRLRWGMDVVYGGWHVTRCDVACDVTGWALSEGLRDCMVGSRRRGMYQAAEIATHGGRVVETIYFAGVKSDLGLVVYDKSKQLAARKGGEASTYAPIWQGNGWKEGQQVTRWEFRASGSALRFVDTMGEVHDLSDPTVLGDAGEIALAWSTWTAARRVVMPTRSRAGSCPVHPWWTQVQLAGGLPPMRRPRPREDIAEEGLRRRMAHDAQQLAKIVHRNAARVGLEVLTEDEGHAVARRLWRDGFHALGREQTMRLRAGTWANERRLTPRDVLEIERGRYLENMRERGCSPALARMSWGRPREQSWLRTEAPSVRREILRLGLFGLRLYPGRASVPQPFDAAQELRPRGGPH